MDVKSGQLRERTARSKLSDVVIIAIIFIIALILEFQIISVDPHQQFIPGLDNLSNPNYNFAYPNLESTVSTFDLIMIVVVPWYTLMLFDLIVLYVKDENFSWRLYGEQIYLIHRMILFCFATTLLSVDCIKLFVGSPRPYYLSVQYNGDETEAVDARLSFVSGHSATGLANCLLLSMMMFKSWQYTQRVYFEKMMIDRPKCDNPHCYYLSGLWWALREVPLLSVLLIGVPTYIAVWNGLTRIRDYKHFAADVVGGWCVGGFIALCSYLLFFQETYAIFTHDWIQKAAKKRETDRKRVHSNGSDENLSKIPEEDV